MSSTELSQRIDALAAEIAANNDRLSTMLAEKTHVLHDEKKLLALEREETDLPIVISRLEERRRLLGMELEQVVKTEAHERVREIETEQAAIASRITARRTAFLQGVDELLKRIRADTPDRTRWEELQAEGGYLVEAYGTAWPQARAALALSDNDLTPLSAEFRQSHWLLHAGTQWKEKTAAIRKRKNAVATAAADAQRASSHTRMVRSTPTPFTPSGGSSQRGVE